MLMTNLATAISLQALYQSASYAKLGERKLFVEALQIAARVKSRAALVRALPEMMAGYAVWGVREGFGF